MGTESENKTADSPIDFSWPSLATAFSELAPCSSKTYLDFLKPYCPEPILKTKPRSDPFPRIRDTFSAAGVALGLRMGAP